MALTAAERRKKRAALAAQRRAEEAQRQRDIAEQTEREEEELSPAAQRRRRTVRDGISFRVGSPIARLYIAGQKRTASGLEPTLGLPHLKAADRLMRAWEMSRTITAGTSSYGQSGVGGAAHSGILSQTVINAVNHQLTAHDEINRARGHLGVLWGVTETVVLLGHPLAAYAARTATQPLTAGGYLRASLDVLIAFYRAEDENEPC